MKTLREADAVPHQALPILRECKQAVRRILPDATLMLYGSLARGTAGPESDWDILVLTESPLSADEEGRVRQAVYAVEVKEDVVLSLLIYARQEWDDPFHRAMPFHEEVEREGLVL